MLFLAAQTTAAAAEVMHSGGQLQPPTVALVGVCLRGVGVFREKEREVLRVDWISATFFISELVPRGRWAITCWSSALEWPALSEAAVIRAADRSQQDLQQCCAFTHGKNKP